MCTERASAVEEARDKRIPQVRRGIDDGMYRRNAQEAREADDGGGESRNGHPARVRSGRVGGGEVRRSEETE